MYAIFGTKEEAQKKIDEINADNINSQKWIDGTIDNYAYVIELEVDFAVVVLDGYENYFTGLNLVDSIVPKKSNIDI